MFLELAEGGEYTPPPMYMSERVRVRGYKRKGNTVSSHFRNLSEEVDLDIEDNPYVFIPDLTGATAGYQVREDYFDGLTDSQWKELMYQLLPYQVPVQQGMSEDMYLAGLFGTRATRKAKRDAKQEKKDAKTQIKLAKAEAIKNGTWKGGGGMLDNISSVLGNIAGGIFGVTPADAQTPGAPGTAPTPGGSFWNDNTMGIPNKILIPSVAVAAVGGAYLYRRRKKKNNNVR